jgi:predicted small secreted protein
MRLMNSLILAGLLGLLAACNTVSGFGEDLSSGGEAISDTAQDVEQDL